MDIKDLKFGLWRKKQNIRNDIIISKDTIVANKIIDRLFVSIDVCIDQDGDTKSKILRDALLTEGVKNGIKGWLAKRDDVIKELLDSIQQDLKER